MTERLQAQSTQGALPNPNPDVGAAPAVAAATPAGQSATTTTTTPPPPPPPPVNGAVAAAASAAAAAAPPVSAPAAAPTPGLPVDAVATKIELVEEEPYTIKCICECSDDDGNTIYCETCDTWQHIDCFYPNNREEALRDEFAHSCAECKPRPLDRPRAIERLRLLKIISEIDDEVAAELGDAANAAAAAAAAAATSAASPAPTIEKKPKRPPSKGHKKKPKPADLPPTNGSGSGSGSGRSGYENGKHAASPTDHLHHHHHQQQPAAKKAKTSHKSSQSVSSSASQPTHVPPPPSSSKRTPPPHGVVAPAHHLPTHHLLSPATTPPDLPDNFRIHAYSAQFCSLYSEPPVSIVHSNSFANLIISNTMSLWLREPVRLREETGRSYDEIFEDLSVGSSAQRPHLRLGEKTSMLDAGGGLLHWRFLTTDGPIDKDVPLAELNGAVGFQKDYCTACDSRWSELTSPLPFVFFHPLLPLYIDTRREGSQARYVRRSCRPNTQLGTSLSGESQYHFWLVSDRPIGPNEQITLPWDFRLPKQSGARWLHLLGLADGESHRHEAEMTDEEYGQISEWVHRILSEYGGCACDLGSNCAFARFHRHYLFAKSQQQHHQRQQHQHHQYHQTPQQKQQQQEPQLHPQQLQLQQSEQPQQEQQPRPTAKKKPPLPAPPSASSSAKRAKTHTVSPTSTGHATNSRAPSENRNDDGPDTDSRSGSDNRSKPPSRDRTPVRQGSFDQLGILTEPTDRDKRKVAMAEDTFRRMEEQQQQPPRKKKRGSDGAMTGQPGAAIFSRPKTNTAPILTSTDCSYVDAASGTSRSKSASPMSAVSPSTARGSVPPPRAGGPGPATAWSTTTLRPVYVDAAVQTDPENAETPLTADSEFKTPKPRKRIISLTQRLLSSRHDMVLREAERRRSLPGAERPETPATPANSILTEVDRATPSSRQRSASVATAVSDFKGSPMLSRPGSTAPADSPMAEPAPLSPTTPAHPPIKPEMPSPTTSLEIIRTDLIVQALPPVPLFRQSSPGAATAGATSTAATSTTNTPPVTSPPLLQSPFLVDQAAGCAPPPVASSAATATPSPVKKKMSLTDYFKTRSPNQNMGSISITNLSNPTGEDVQSAEPTDSPVVDKAAENETVA